MTDTRTTPQTTDERPQTAGPAPDERLQTTEPVADERPRTAEPASNERPTGDAPAQELSTADIARGAVTEREPTPATGRSHQTDIPEARTTPLFSDDAANDLRERWTDIQAGFVDEPRSSVEHADALVAEVMKRLADSFATERQALEQQWSAGEDASTEDLRVALRRYRSFFDRLLAI